MYTKTWYGDMILIRPCIKIKLMRYNHIILFLALLFLGGRLNGQVVQGYVIDSLTRQGVPFANIGVLHKNVGTVSNEAGKFKLDVTGMHTADTIKISCIGYKDFVAIVPDFKWLGDSIVLSPKATQLGAVIVMPVEIATLTMGVETQSTTITGGFVSNDLGSELGTVFNYRKKKPGVLKKVSFNIASSGYDTLLFRFNVYKMQDGLPGENILKKPVFVKTAIKKGIVDVDLSSYAIVVDGPVLVSLEWVRNLYGGNLFFSFNLLKRASFARKTSQADWLKTPGSAGIWGVVEIEK